MLVQNAGSVREFEANRSLSIFCFSQPPRALSFPHIWDCSDDANEVPGTPVLSTPHTPSPALFILPASDRCQQESKVRKGKFMELNAKEVE